MQKKWNYTFVTALLGMILTAIPAMATPPPGGWAPIAPPSGGFDIDGDLLANTQSVNTGDWTLNTNVAPGNGLSVLGPNGVPLDPIRTFHFVDAYNDSADNIFNGGSKWVDNPNTWGWTTGKPSSKTDINNVLLHVSSDTNGHVWAVIAADRLSTSGDSYIDFEFLQSPLTLNGNGTITSGGLNGGRSTNDILLSVGFTGGGKVADFFAWRWQAGGGGFAYIDVTTNLPAGRVFVALNAGTAATPYSAFGQMSYAPNAFAEAAIDLTALLGNFDPCFSVGFKTIMVKTKSSSSSSASIEDFINPIQFSLNIGPGANAGPDQVRCSEGTETAFPLQGTASSGLQSVGSIAWSVVNGNAIIDDPASLVTTARVASTSATLRLTVTQINGCVKTDDIVLSAQQPPTCSISGVTNTCQRTTNTFSAATGMNSYLWTVTGNGSISGPANQPTVKVIAGPVCGANYTLSLTMVTNVCTVACSTDVSVVDTGAPVLTCPPDRVLDCPAVTTTNVTGMATATDSCSRATVTYSDSETNGCGTTKVIARTWTATDECGNSVSCVQTITVRDLTPPVINCPTNRTLEFPADTQPGNTGLATAPDSCSSTTVTFSDLVTTNCGNTLVILRTWTASDQCDNRSSCTQTITVRDTTAPVITCPTNLTLEFPAITTTNLTGVATAIDTGGTVTINYADTTTTNCGNTYTISRRWTATDQCNNSSSCTQTITVRDTTAPVITCPTNLTLEFPAITTTNLTGVATANDTGGTVTINYSDTTTTNCGNTYTIARRWTANDSCSNSSSCTQTITVRDTTAPVINCPTNAILEFPAVTTTNRTGVATANDTGGAVTINYADTTTTNCGNTYTISRRWTATDQCNNSSSCTQTITVRDTTAPVINCPTNVILEFPAVITTNLTGVATANDTGGPVMINYADTTNTNCGNTYTISRRWTATDQCNNSSSCTQTITVRDTTAPVINCPTNAILEFPTMTTTNLTGAASANDTGGTVTINYADTTITNCGNTYTIARRWTATDQCNNSSSCTQTIAVRDTTAPVITCPTNLTLECPAVTTTNATGVATATDAGGAVSITFVDSTTNGCGGLPSITRRWTAIDLCGNSSSCTQTITVRDTTAPIITCPTNVTLEFPAITTTNSTGVATATDSCGSFTITYVDTTTANCGNTFTIARRWTATDQCNNSSSCTQTITVRDTTAPVISCPASSTLDCPAVTTTNATGVATATDAGGAVSITFVDSTTNGCGNTKTIARRWTATDLCGNSSTCMQTLTVRDIAPPVIACPASITVECGTSTLPAVTGTVTASDTCNTVTVSYTDATTNLCGNTRIITRTWTATDACNNKSSCIQTITVRDTMPPSLTVPTNLVMECPGDTRTNVTGVASAVDGCASVSISYSDVVSNSCGATRTVLRLWTATDQCGNATNGLQTIRVVDTQKPRITCPAVSVQCMDDVPSAYTNLAALLAAGGTASDNCDTALTFSMTSAGGLVGSCPGTVTRVYRVTDDCGNFAEATQTIVVDDTIAPVLNCPPGVTIQCGESLDPANTGRASATDNCSTNVVLIYSDAVVPSSYSINWYAADPMVNSAPYMPTYLKLGPGSVPCPVGGRAADPLRNAVAYGPTSSQLDALTSMGGEPMSMGQIVPFEAVIEASGGTGPEHGTIEFTASWSTHTTSNDEFGYDKNYKVYCAFVDTADPGSVDPHNNAKVESFSSTIINTGTVDEKILGTFRVSGLDPGDRAIVEVWVVLMAAQPNHVGGTIASDIVSAQKALTPPETIITGNKTISIGNLNKMEALPAPQQQPPLPPQPPQTPPPSGRLVSAINRTWTATDNCNNRSTCVQQFTVRDATPPTLTVPTNVILECPADTRTNFTGVAVAQDACGAATVTYSDTFSNSCAGTKIITRLWVATDEWDNSTNAVQTITVSDTTPPTLSVVTNKTITAGAVFVFDAPVATDGCGTATVSVVSTTTNNFSPDAYAVTRTWRATDSCGNISPDRTQTITVQSPAPLRLTLAKTPNLGLLIRWPTNSSEYRLECADNLTAKRWYPVAITPIITNAECWVYIETTGPSMFYRLANSPPALEALKMSGGSLHLIWPTAPGGFQLESSDTMAADSWTTVALTPGVSNTLNHVQVPANGSKKFFRLKK